MRLKSRAKFDTISTVLVNGKPAAWTTEASVGCAMVVVDTEVEAKTDIEIQYQKGRHEIRHPHVAAIGDVSDLTPGSTPFALKCSGTWTGEIFSAFSLWNLFRHLPAGHSILDRFRQRCSHIALPYNDKLENIFSYDYVAPRHRTVRFR